MDVVRELKEDLAKRCGPIHARRERLEARLEAIRKQQAEQGAVNAAKIAVLGRTQEELIAAGKPEKAAQRGLEIAAIREETEQMTREAGMIESDLEGIERDLKQAAEKTLAAVYPAAQADIISKMDEALNAQDAAWAGLREFERMTGIRLTGLHRDGLRFVPYGPSKEVFRRLRLVV